MKHLLSIVAALSLLAPVATLTAQESSIVAVDKNYNQVKQSGKSEFLAKPYSTSGDTTILNIYDRVTGDYLSQVKMLNFGTSASQYCGGVHYENKEVLIKDPVKDGDTLFLRKPYPNIDVRSALVVRELADYYAIISHSGDTINLSSYEIDTDSLCCIDQYMTLNYLKSKRVSQSTFWKNGRVRLHYTFFGKGDYQLWQYYENGQLRRHETFVAKSKEKTGELYDEQGKELKFFPYRVEPSYPGGTKSLLNFIRQNLRYPVECARNGIQGRVMAEFIVGTDGKLDQIKVIKSPNTLLSGEAVRIIKKMKKWKPGMQDGKPVRVKYVLPIEFRMH